MSGAAGLARAGLALHLFSGDQTASVEAMARRLGIADARARCTPQDKLAGVEALQAAAACGRRWRSPGACTSRSMP